MKDENKDLRERTKEFAIRVVRMFSALPKSTEAQVLGKQVLRSGTSVGANYREACRARSKAEFIAKVARCHFMVMIVILVAACAASGQVANAANDRGNNNKADASGLFIYVHQPAESLATVTPVEILVTDSNGQRTGFDVGTGATLREIPNSRYSAEAIADDIDPASGLTTEEVKSFEAMWPASGNYSLQIIGTGTGPYTIDILAYDFNGTESIQTITGNATRGAGTVYQVGYSSVAGSQVSATLMNNIYTIVATAGSGGSISPSGTVVVYSGSNRTFAIRPNTGYKVADVTIDGVSQGAITSYNFTNVTASHTVTATFTK